MRVSILFAPNTVTLALVLNIVAIGEGCCSWNLKACGNDAWCNTSESNCKQCNGFFIDPSKVTECTALWIKCSNSSQCCSPGQCVFTNGWQHCDLPTDTTLAPSPMFAPNPNSHPTPTLPSLTQKPTLPLLTPKPTLPLTQKPTLPQTQKPTLPLTQKPTLPLTAKPTLPLTPQPTLPLTQKPTLPLTQKPTLPLTPKPTLPLTSKPTLPLTPKPTLPLTPKPTLPLTPRPTLPLTPEHTLPLTPKPTLPLTPKPSLPLTPKPTLPLTPKPTLPLTPKPSPRPSQRPTTSITNFPTKSPISNPSLTQLIATANERIRGTIAINPDLAANYLRLGFHDCVPNGPAGGCDGCLNLETNGENKGLNLGVQALAPIVAELENTSIGFSRADIWALAVLVAADASQTQITFSDAFIPGRQTCEMLGSCVQTSNNNCATNGTDTRSDFPTTVLTTHELINFMSNHFGFSADETVALMGAHTLGKALPENSGYQGQNGWVTNRFLLDNEYYKMLAGTPDLVANAPNWDSIRLQNRLVQWIRNDGSPSREIFMLNVDVALARNLAGFDFLPECKFHSPGRCPVAATLTKAGIYRNNNLVWLTDFKKVLVRMLDKGRV